jgi:hypothetical protein
MAGVVKTWKGYHMENALLHGRWHTGASQLDLTTNGVEAIYE